MCYYLVFFFSLLRENKDETPVTVAMRSEKNPISLESGADPVYESAGCSL